MNQSLPYFIALTKTDYVGPVLAKQLIAYCGGPKEVFDKSTKELAEIPSIGPKVAAEVGRIDPLAIAKNELEFIKNNQIQPIDFLSDAYPRRLKHFDDAPILLYYSGSVDLNHHRMVGIVGTRKPTDYGVIMAEKIVEGLSNYDPVIVSGMAYGIDSVTHRKSVEIGLPTIGVLGHGLDRIYPYSNRNLSKKMIQNGGLLTEFPSGTNPDRENFPMRNRIIAALSDAVLVVESKIRGGSIITTEFANNYNKDVFAIPGKTSDENSAGCNKLIKIHKAYLAESAADIAYIMRWDEIDRQKNAQTTLFPDLNNEETIIVEAIREVKEITIDRLHYKVNKPLSELATLLLTLEFKGVVKSLPGKKYCLV